MRSYYRYALLCLAIISAGLFCVRSDISLFDINSPAAIPSAAESRYIITWSDTDTDLHTKELSPFAASLLYDDELFSVILAAPDTALQLAGSPYIEAVEEDSPLDLASLPSDYFIETEYWLSNPGSYLKYSADGFKSSKSLEDIDLDATEGWEQLSLLENKGVPVTVAVIDTGIDYTHPDLQKRMWINDGEIPDNGIDDDGNGYIDDIYGWDFYNNDASVCHYHYSEEYAANLSTPEDCDDHGTHVAGIIAAEYDNSIGISGVSGPVDVRLMSLKIHGGPNRSGSISDAIIAIRYAERNGADICNISWGTYSSAASLYTAISRSRMLFVCAAGNDGTDNDLYPLYPASFRLNNVLSVAYVDAKGKLTSGSNYGLLNVDIAAPGTSVFSTIVGTYSYMSGSSMAAPMVTGLAAVIYSFGKGIYASEVRDLIIETAKPQDMLIGSVSYPAIPSLVNAIEHIDSVEYDLTPPDFSVSASYDKDSIILNFDTYDEGGSGVLALSYFIGTKESTAFGNGSLGTLVSDNRLLLNKGGVYTFYLKDAAGNYMLKSIKLLDDMIPPYFKDLHFTVGEDDSDILISGQVSDSQSGVKSIKFKEGKYETSDFKSGATALETDEEGHFEITVTNQGIYTFCAQDYRGNKQVKRIMTYIMPSTEASFADDSISVPAGDYFTPEYLLLPAKTTDIPVFVSSDEDIVAFDTRSGKLLAKAAGEAELTLLTRSGCTSICKIIVTEPKPSPDTDASTVSEPSEETDASAESEPSEETEASGLNDTPAKSDITKENEAG